MDASLLFPLQLLTPSLFRSLTISAKEKQEVLCVLVCVVLHFSLDAPGENIEFGGTDIRTE